MGPDRRGCIRCWTQRSSEPVTRGAEGARSRPPASDALMAGATCARHPAILAVAGLLSLAVGIGIGRFAYTPILPYMIAGLELDRSQAGLIASANYLGYFVGALAAAWRAVPGQPRALAAGGARVVRASARAPWRSRRSLGPFLILRFVGRRRRRAGDGARVLPGDGPPRRSRPRWLGGGDVCRRRQLASRSRPWPFRRQHQETATGKARGCSAAGWPSCSPSWPRCYCAYHAHRRQRRPRPGGGAGQKGLSRLIVAYGLVGFGYVITATFVADMVRADPVLQPAEHLVWLCVGLTAAPSVALWGWAGRRWGNERAVRRRLPGRGESASRSAFWAAASGPFCWPPVFSEGPSWGLPRSASSRPDTSPPAIRAAASP